MAEAKDNIDKPRKAGQRDLFPASQSQTFQQARSNWQKSWQAVVEQCKDCFIRY